MLTIKEYLLCNEARTKTDKIRQKRKLMKSFKKFLKDHDQVSTVIVYGVMDSK